LEESSGDLGCIFCNQTSIRKPMRTHFRLWTAEIEDHHMRLMTGFRMNADWELVEQNYGKNVFDEDLDLFHFGKRLIF
jgi:hypothetical protein